MYGPVSDRTASVECGLTEYGGIVWFEAPAHWPDVVQLMSGERNNNVNEVLDLMITKYFDFSIKVTKQSF